MIAKYQDNYFNIDKSIIPPRIWRYDFVDNFEKRVHKTGLVIYEKFVDLSELNEVFDVGFSALWNGEWCGVSYSAQTDEVALYSSNDYFAEQYGMQTLDRGYYAIAVPADSVSQYKFIYKDAINKTVREELISLEQLRVLWKQFHTDLMPLRR